MIFSRRSRCATERNLIVFLRSTLCCILYNKCFPRGARGWSLISIQQGTTLQLPQKFQREYYVYIIIILNTLDDDAEKKNYNKMFEIKINRLFDSNECVSIIIHKYIYTHTEHKVYYYYQSMRVKPRLKYHNIIYIHISIIITSAAI